ncbi:unnamed protein product [Clonostachys rosea f. rosea IK726]|uniref:Uncharacterized protein n=2 Tax=Bionectria ochroleuca TaxID=29856 RepID=A0ACA9U4W8_BIOOC|nr:unnamed protein product [Clonostachys rosea f. rosea IK726]
MAPSPKTFQSDDSVLSAPIKSLLATLYMTMDENKIDEWGAHFTEDAVFKKEAAEIKGRQALIDSGKESWKPLKSRDHTVYKVFPFGPDCDEIMLHGRSQNVDLEGNERTFTWAARMHFRTVEGKLLIDEYTIIPDYHR